MRYRTSAGSGERLQGSARFWRTTGPGDDVRESHCRPCSYADSATGGTMRTNLFATVLIAVGILMGTLMVSAQRVDPWLGTWQIDLAHSVFDPGPAPHSGTFTAELLPDGAQRHVYDGVAANGSKNHSERVTRLDGAESPTAYTGSARYSARTDVYRRIDSHSFEILIKDAGEVVARTLTVVSPDGRSLTQTRTGKTPDGRSLRNVIVHIKR